MSGSRVRFLLLAVVSPGADVLGTWWGTGDYSNAKRLASLLRKAVYKRLCDGKWSRFD